MEFPKQVRAVSVFFGQTHQQDFGHRRVDDARKFIEENEQEKDVVAIVWLLNKKPTQLYSGGKWNNYDGAAKPPILPKGRLASGQGTTTYIPARLAAIVAALESAEDWQLKSLEQILSVTSIHKD